MSLSVKKSFKSFTGSRDAKKIRPFYVFFPKLSAYIWHFDETKYMFFMIKDDKYLEKYNEVWKKVRNSIKKEFGGEPICNEKYLKTKIKYYSVKINTNFHKRQMKRPKEGSKCLCLSIISVNFVLELVKIIMCC